MIEPKHSDNCHPKREHSSVRTWQLHSSQSWQFFLVLITLFPSSYYTDALDQKGSQEPFLSKNLAFSFSQHSFALKLSQICFRCILKDHQLLVKRFTSFSYFINVCSRIQRPFHCLPNFVYRSVTGTGLEQCTNCVTISAKDSICCFV